MVNYDWEAGLIFGSFMLSGKSYFDYIERRRYVEVLCDCGVIKWVRFDSIKRGWSTSCGCIVKERMRTTKPSVTHGFSNHPLYVVYRCMMNRCLDNKHKAYPNYGGRGVTICAEWINDFMSFFNWALSNCWKEGLELDKDILYAKKHGTKSGLLYSPEYCQFVTPSENGRNKSTSRMIEYNGVILSLAGWAERIGIKDNALGERLNRYGWSVEKALTTPLKLYKRL